MRWIADGPNSEVPTFSGYKINGVNFSTKDRDDVRTVQNSGVSLVANAMQVASARDKRPISDDMNFYGVIREIWELDYYAFRVPIFKCDWVENDKGIKIDDLGFTLVNLNRIGHLNDSFVLATDVKQICYIDDPLNIDWSVVLRCPDREYNGGGDDDEVEDIQFEHEAFVATMPAIQTFDNVVGETARNYMRDDDEGIWVD